MHLEIGIWHTLHRQLTLVIGPECVSAQQWHTISSTLGLGFLRNDEAKAHAHAGAGDSGNRRDTTAV